MLTSPSDFEGKKEKKKAVMQTIDEVKNDNTGVNIEGITMLT